jgi:hypothetical protein
MLDVDMFDDVILLFTLPFLKIELKLYLALVEKTLLKKGDIYELLYRREE